MKLKENFFYKKKILIYGLGKSGSACFDFLNRNNNLLVFDDNFSVKNKKYSNYFFPPDRIKKIITIFFIFNRKIIIKN